MGLRTEVASSYLSVVETGNIRYVVQPAAAVGVPMISDGAALAWAWAAYVEIIGATVVTDPSWLCGVSMHTCAAEDHYGDFAVASGAALAEVDLSIIPYSAGFPGATVLGVFETLMLPIWLPHPIKLVGQPRLAGRIRKDTGVSAAGFTCKAVLAEAIGV